MMNISISFPMHDNIETYYSFLFSLQLGKAKVILYAQDRGKQSVRLLIVRVKIAICLIEVFIALKTVFVSQHKISTVRKMKCTLVFKSLKNRSTKFFVCICYFGYWSTSIRWGARYIFLIQIWHFYCSRDFYSCTGRGWWTIFRNWSW